MLNFRPLNIILLANFGDRLDSVLIFGDQIRKESEPKAEGAARSLLIPASSFGSSCNVASQLVVAEESIREPIHCTT